MKKNKTNSNSIVQGKPSINIDVANPTMEVKIARSKPSINIDVANPTMEVKFVEISIDNGEAECETKTNYDLPEGYFRGENCTPYDYGKMVRPVYEPASDGRTLDGKTLGLFVLSLS